MTSRNTPRTRTPKPPRSAAWQKFTFTRLERGPVVLSSRKMGETWHTTMLLMA